MKKLINIIIGVVIPISGSVTSAIELAQNRFDILNYGVPILGCALIIFAYFFFKKKDNYRFYKYSFYVSGWILIIISVGSFIYNNRQTTRIKLWNQYISANQEVDSLALKAESNDGPAQYELACRYLNDFDYKQAQVYAHKAAINGNAQSYMILSHIYKNGLGCRPDKHQAVGYAIEAMKKCYIESYSPNNIINDDFMSSLSSTERIALEDCFSNASLLSAIQSETMKAFSEEHERGAIKVLNAHYDELFRLSKEGYIPATELLYVREKLRQVSGTQELERLAKILYQVNRIPTAHWERFLFYNYISDNKYIDKFIDSFSKHIKIFIQNNTYPYLIPEIAPLDNPCEQYSNKLLVSEYELLRAQYNWSKDLVVNPHKRVDFLIQTISNNQNDAYQTDYSLSKYLLKRRIRCVQDRMNYLEESYDNKNVYIEDIDLKIHIE